MRRNKHSLSNYKLFTADMGKLIPIGMYEVLPGDTCQQSTTAIVRAAPLLAPVMHPVDIRVHHWYVPYRILWDNFPDFITGGEDGNDATVHPTTTVPAINNTRGSLFDYLGIPPGAERTFSSLPHRAYALIFNEWYRDQDLTAKVPYATNNGDDPVTNWALLDCAWEKDYFTSARPWEQKGPAITVPLGTTAPVAMREAGTLARTARRAGAGANSNLEVSEAGTTGAAIDWETDLSTASAVTVNVLREALALQRYEEARARFGSRYTEYLRYLGVKSSDARLQRPEFLGGGRQTIQFSEVLATAEGTNTNVGDLKGHGISQMRSNRYRRFFEEHGVVMSLMSVRPKSMYTQGLPRHFNRRIKEDYWQKELEHIGQQEIQNKEIYADAASPDGTFGFQDRYDEYRSQPSTIAGEFRDSTLDYWHLGRNFASEPALNGDFVKCEPTKRVFAAQENNVLQVMAKHSVQARRLVAQTGQSFIY